MPTIRDARSSYASSASRTSANEWRLGLGEPPIIPSSVANARERLGARVRHAPLTPARVLAALARLAVTPGAAPGAQRRG